MTDNGFTKCFWAHGLMFFIHLCSQRSESCFILACEWLRLLRMAFSFPSSYSHLISMNLFTCELIQTGFWSFLHFCLSLVAYFPAHLKCCWNQIQNKHLIRKTMEVIVWNKRYIFSVLFSIKFISKKINWLSILIIFCTASKLFGRRDGILTLHLTLK